MNENINLYKILRGHENKVFYSPIYGNVKIDFGISGDNESVLRMYPTTEYICYLPLSPNGCHFDYSNNTEIIIFPSKDQRDWNKWDKENNPDVPKTWSEYHKNDDIRFMPSTVTWDIPVYFNDITVNGKKSALAFLKIRELIEVGYGGNVINDEWIDRDITKYFISFGNDNIIGIEKTILSEEFSHIAFHTKEQAEEFLKYPENVQLLKDYFMI